MALTSVTTNFITSSFADTSTSDFALVPCRTTLANLGPLTTTTFTPPSSCQAAPTFTAFSDLIIGNTTLFPCSDPLAYLSCKPSAELVAPLIRKDSASCNKVLTYYSPAWIKPPGWTWIGGFVVTPTADSGGRVTYSLISMPGVNVIVHDELVPKVTGTHSVYCPTQWTLEPSGSSYACRSIGHIPTNGNQEPYCSVSCDATNATDCKTITTSLTTGASASRPTDSVTYGIDPAYLIFDLTDSDGVGDGRAAERERARRTLAVLIILPIAGAVLVAVVVMAVVRWRYLRRQSAKGAKELELPAYPGPCAQDISDPQHMRNALSPPWETGSVTSSVADPPPVYRSTEVRGENSRAEEQ